jgi:hypothetical protein
MANKSSASRLAAETYVSGNGVLLHFASALPDQVTTDTGRPKTQTVNGVSADIVEWGNKNDVPQFREELIAGNGIVPALIKRKRDLVLGQNWYAYQIRYQPADNGANERIRDEVPMPAEAEAFFEQHEMVFYDLVGELMKHDLALAEFVRNMDGTISSVSSKETKYLRAEQKDTKGRRSAWWWSNAWTADMTRNIKKQEDRVLQRIPLWNGTQRDDPKRQDRFGIELCDGLFNDGNYPIPSYWGSRYWIELANVVPLFHLANLKNMSAPRWLLIIPHDYFLDYEKMTTAISDEEKAVVLSSAKARKAAFIDDFNDLVTGIGKNGRTLTIESIQEEVFGKTVDKRIQVEPLVIDLRDEALIKLNEASTVANISAQGLHPTLANIETQGRLSSGTEIRNAYLLWLIIAAPLYRKWVYKVVNMVKSQNGWPAEIYYGIRDAELTTLAENPSGVRPAETPVAQ